MQIPVPRVVTISAVDPERRNDDIIDRIRAGVMDSRHAELTSAVSALAPMTASLPDVPPLLEGEQPFDAAVPSIVLVMRVLTARGRAVAGVAFQLRTVHVIEVRTGRT